jgi:hypothetical protein
MESFTFVTDLCCLLTVSFFLTNTPRPRVLNFLNELSVSQVNNIFILCYC